MSTTLEVTFRCMCLFVTDEQTGQTHVLMPSTATCGHGDHAGHGHEGGDGATIPKHEVKLIYPMRGGRLSGDGETIVADPQEDGMAQDDDLEGWSLVLPSVDGGTPPTEVKNLDVFLPDLSKVTGRKIDRALLNGTSDPRVASRVTLNAGGISAKHAPIRWNFDDLQKAFLAQEVTWSIENLSDEPLRLRKVRLGAGENPGPDQVHEYPPIQANEEEKDENGNHLIRLHVLHTVFDGFPKLAAVEPQDAILHFPAYYCLFDEPVATPVPEFVIREHVGVSGCLGGRARG